MSKELIISSSRHETKVGILEDDQLVEIYFQRANEYSLAGSIHKGRVTRVLPGMQSAFVDLGLERDTFLYVSDFFDENGDDFDRLTPEDKPVVTSRRQEEPASISAAVAAHVGADEFEAPADTLPAAQTAPSVFEGGASAGRSESPAPREQRNQSGGGRRGRRRRSNSGGFPDSKYASATLEETPTSTSSPLSDLDVAPEPESEIVEGNAFQEPEIVLLPGESLAKYRQKPVTSEPIADADAPARTTSVGEPARPSRIEAPITETQVFPEAEDVVAAEPAAVETLVAATQAPAVSVDTVTEAEPVTAAEEPTSVEQAPGPDVAAIAEAGPIASDEEPTLSAVEAEEEPASDLPEDDSVTSAIEEAVAAAEESAATSSEAAIGADESLVADEEEELLAVVQSTLEGESDGSAEGFESEATVEAEPDGETDAAGEENGGGRGMSASVREPGSRYPHRGQRRTRRRGRGGEQKPQTATPVPPPVVEIVVAEPVVAEPRVKIATERPPLPSITDLLREGQEIIVQIAKEPLGQKGARITSHIALPGRYVVYMPTLEHLGVSRKIASDEERLRLKRILQTHRTGILGGFIVRTAGEGHTEQEIGADMAYLYNLWLDIRQKAEKRPAPLLLHHDLDIVQRILRDQLNDMFKAVWVDNEEVYESVLRFLQRFQPALVNRVKLYTRPQPIFDAFGITSEIEKALRPKVWLKSGGYIVVNQTEALVAIDVNTGKYVGKSNRLEDTITKTNTEAVKEIVRQIRLRDLGGIIVVDFIDMDERKNRQKVMQTLEEAMRVDRAPYKILQFNDFGLVAITRKRVKQSLERTLCAPCPACEGAGYVKSVATVVAEILQEATKVRPMVDGKNVILRTHPDVAKYLKSSKNAFLEEIEENVGRPVLVTSDPMLHPEKFDLAW
jgi:ribonuclease G